MPEYLWYTSPRHLAGGGTGLVGLSAATAMVPILIVLCPSFTGETRAYQATAIAIASDIVKGEKLDLKGGAISLFFWLTIGSGTGFVGSGGGLTLVGPVCQPGE